jgi:hypothetical protein
MTLTSNWRDATSVPSSEFWYSVLPISPRVDWSERVSAIAAEAEPRRGRADYDTGSISEAEAYSLIALAEFLAAETVLEVGTFIGMSTSALASGSRVAAVYTCDASNDCLPKTAVIRTYPKRTSTQMFRELLARGVRADLCFFDGVLDRDDAVALADLTYARTVYAFHDYNYGPKIRRQKGGGTYLETVPRKGVGNVELLQPRLPGHTLVAPLAGSTLALLVPEALL